MVAKVLAIDDMKETIDLLASVLKNRLNNVEMLYACNGLEGIEKARDLQPDLIFLDVKMPNLDGFKVCTILKQDPYTSHIPVLMISEVMVESKYRMEGIDSGADGYLYKPFDTEELVTQVKALIRTKQSKDRLRESGARLQDELKQQTAALEVNKQQLERDRNHMNLLMDNIPDAIYFKDEEGRFTRINQAFAQFLGLENPEEAEGKKVADLIKGNLLEQYQRDDEELLLSGATVIDKTEKIQCPDGETRWFSSTKVPFYNPNETRPAGMVGISRNITERKRIDEALRDIAKGASTMTGLPFFYSLVEELAHAMNVDIAFIGELDHEHGQTLHAVSVFCRDDIVDNFSIDVKGSPYEQILTKQQFCFLENIQDLFPGVAHLEELKAECLFGMPLFNAEKEPIGVLGIMHSEQVSEPFTVQTLLQIFSNRTSAELDRMRAVEELYVSEEKYRSLTDDVLDYSNVGIFIVDSDRNVVWANHALEHYLNVQRDDIQGIHVTTLVDRIAPLFDKPIACKDAFLRALSSDQAHESFECLRTKQDQNDECWLEQWSQPIQTGLYAGGHIGYFNDITERKELEAQLIQAQKMEGIGRLAGGIAHDFNNLLTSILGFSRLIADEITKDSPVYPEVTEIINAGERAAKLTGQLLAFGRKQIMQVKQIDLNAVVSNMDQLLRRTLGEDVEFTTVLESGLGSIKADTGQLEQIVMNLAINARDALPKGGTLTIKTAKVVFDEESCKNNADLRPGKFAMLSIADSGYGMAKEVREHAFEPFFTTKEQGKGTGLGLSTVYGIVKQFEGGIEIISEPGQGTEVRIYFPRNDEHPEKPATPVGGALPTGDETILVVEDEDTVRKLTVRILELQGYNILQARNGLDALSVYDEFEENIDLIMTDVVMPQMGGQELIKNLKLVRGNFKILFTSGFSDTAIQGEEETGARPNIILKPYTREGLTRMVRHILDAV